MSFSTRLLSATLGRVSPRYRTLGEWATTYRQIIAAKPISDKTKANRRSSLGRLVDGLGEERIISGIRPHEVAGLVMDVHAQYPQCAKRLLIEAREVFNEALNYGWLLRNPAQSVKSPVVRVRRQRLTLEQWQAIHTYAVEYLPPWVSRMLVLALVTGQRRSDLCKMRFDDVWDGHLHVEQAKTGARIALPLSLRLDAIGVTLEEAIEDCRAYAVGAEFLLRKHNGQAPGLASLSARFEDARNVRVPLCRHGLPASLHECRSLSERLYRARGVDTRTLLGHKHQAMTDVYNNDRGLSSGEWKRLALPWPIPVQPDNLP